MTSLTSLNRIAQKLKDVEMCKTVAKIEGRTVCTRHTYDGPKLFYGTECQDRKPEFNLITDDALCWKLMLKHGIAVTEMEDGDGENVYICYRQGAYQNVTAILSEDKSPNRALGLAIVEKFENV